MPINGALKRLDGLDGSDECFHHYWFEDGGIPDSCWIGSFIDLRPCLTRVQV